MRLNTACKGIFFNIKIQQNLTKELRKNCERLPTHNLFSKNHSPVIVLATNEQLHVLYSHHYLRSNVEDQLQKVWFLRNHETTFVAIHSRKNTPRGKIATTAAWKCYELSQKWQDVSCNIYIKYEKHQLYVISTYFAKKLCFYESEKFSPYVKLYERNSWILKCFHTFLRNLIVQHSSAGERSWCISKKNWPLDNFRHKVLFFRQFQPPEIHRKCYFDSQTAYFCNRCLADCPIFRGTQAT